MNSLSFRNLEDKVNNNIHLSEKKSRLALSSIKGIGYHNYSNLIKEFGSAKSTLTASYNNLIKVHSIGKSLANDILTIKFNVEEYDFLDQDELEIIDINDKSYSSRLKNTYSPPVVLYKKGKFDLNPQRSLSIVGTRNCTSYGKDFVTDLIKSLGDHNVHIVSGLAYGIDVHTHKVALEHNITNIGILPCEINSVYPSRHASIASQMLLNGGLISEYAPNTKQEKQFFPARNRIIAGLSDATIIIEAGKKSGALITAEFANEYDREIFALPGDYLKKQSEGCNNLIKNNKARVITDISDLIENLNWDIEDNKKLSPIKLDIDESLQSSINIIQSHGKEIPYHLFEDKLRSQRLNVSKILMKLQVQDLIEKTPGNGIKMKRNIFL